MINQDNNNYQLLLNLFSQNQDYFEEIDLTQYSDEDDEILYRDGESDLIKINNKIYRFNWEDVYQFNINNC